MVAVMRKAPYVNQLTERWCENLRTAVRAVTDDDRLTRATARDISGLSGPLSYWGDNLEKYLEATGQESVAAEKFFSAAFGYAARHFSRIARSDNRVSIDSHADAPADLQADLYAMRGRLPPSGVPTPDVEPAATPIEAFESLSPRRKASVLYDTFCGDYVALPAGLSAEQIGNWNAHIEDVPDAVAGRIADLTEVRGAELMLDDLLGVSIDGTVVGYAAFFSHTEGNGGAWVAFDASGRELHAKV